MGTYRISSTMELFALLAFLGILASNFVFVTLLLFGNVGWSANVSGTMGSEMTYLYVFLLFLILTSIGFMVYILTIPLRLSSHDIDVERGMLDSKERQIKQSEHREGNGLVNISDENHKSDTNVSHENLLDSSVDPIQGAHESDQDQNSPFSSVSQIVQSVVDYAFTEEPKDMIFLQNFGLMESRKQCARLGDFLPQNDQVVGSSESLESSTISVPKVKGKSVAEGEAMCDGSRKDATSGLGPAGRHQLAAILNEFWGLLFDYHGKQTKEAEGVIRALSLDLDFEFQNAKAEQAPGPKIPVDGYNCSPLSQSISTDKGNLDSIGLSLSPVSLFTDNGNQVIGNLPQHGSSSSRGNSLEDLFSYRTFPIISLEYPLGLQKCIAVSSDKSDLLSGCKDPTCKHTESMIELKPFPCKRIIESQNNVLKPPHVTWCGKKLCGSSGCTITFISYDMGERLVLHSLRTCIRKLLSLDASGWLFSQGGGSDEKLIDCFAELVKDGPRDGVNEDLRNSADRLLIPIMPGCGTKYCIWRAGLLVCFGVWCVRRILDLLLVESRPELWGQYAFVLNRLQGILFAASREERKFEILPCKCLFVPDPSCITKAIPFVAPRTSSKHILELMKNAEIAILGRIGRSGTGVGNIAYLQGKNNLASVFERYERHLTKPPPPPAPLPVPRMWPETRWAYPNGS